MTCKTISEFEDRIFEDSNFKSKFDHIYSDLNNSKLAKICQNTECPKSQIVYSCYQFANKLNIDIKDIDVETVIYTCLKHAAEFGFKSLIEFDFNRIEVIQDTDLNTTYSYDFMVYLDLQENLDNMDRYNKDLVYENPNCMEFLRLIGLSL